MEIENLELEQLDMKMTFLHGDLDEDIYMSQPAGFSATREESHLVCRLKKNLYGLKQASRMWYQKLDSYIGQRSYHRSNFDPCMYTLQLPDVSQIYLILSVEDMLITGSNQAEIGKLKRILRDEGTQTSPTHFTHVDRAKSDD